MKIEALNLPAGALVVTLLVVAPVAHAESWWRLSCPSGSSLQTSGGNFRCVMNVGAANEAPKCPGDFRIEVQAGTDICAKGRRAEETRPVKCKGKEWRLIVDNDAQQDQCIRDTKRPEDKVMNAKCGGEDFTYKIQAGNDTCYRRAKAGKTKPYTCAVGKPRVDGDGKSDRCIDPGTFSYVEPKLNLTSTR